MRRFNCTSLFVNLSLVVVCRNSLFVFNKKSRTFASWKVFEVVTMLVGVINEYLKSNRRLVIPSFGAFVVKGDGDIIFSELLKGDDGVLRALLMEQGASEIVAAAAIDRFIFEVRHDLQESGSCFVVNLGTFSRNAEGVLTFEKVKPEQIVIPAAAAEPVEPVIPTEPVKPVEPIVVPTPTAPPVRPAAKPAPRTARHARKSGGGLLMWIVGVVIAGALLALGYGLYCMWNSPERDLDEQMDAQRIPMIQIPTTTSDNSDIN